MPTKLVPGGDVGRRWLSLNAVRTQDERPDSGSGGDAALVALLES